MRSVRLHWGIEEGHHCLDVDFYQDMMQCKNREFLENNILLNKLAMAATTLFAKENPGKRKKPMSLACRLKSQSRPEIAAETLDWFVREYCRKRYTVPLRTQLIAPIREGNSMKQNRVAFNFAPCKL